MAGAACAHRADRSERRTRSGRGPGRATRAALRASCAGGRGARPGRVVASFSAPFRSWPMAGAASAHRGNRSERRTRSGRGPRRAARAALPASCAGGRGARPGQVVASPSAPFRSWPMAGAAWAHRAGPQRETHALRARTSPRSSRRIAGVVRWWTWRTTGPGRGHPLSAVPVVADTWRGLSTSGRTAARRTRSGRGPGRATRAAQCRRRALVDVVRDRAGSWPGSQRRSCRGRLRTRPGHIKPGRIEAHTPRAPAGPGNWRRNAGVVRWRLWRSTAPGPGHRLRAGPVVADCGRGLARPSRAASRRTRSGHGTGRAARATLPASCAVDVAHDRARSWAASQRRSGRGRWPARPGRLEVNRIEAHALRARNWPGGLRRDRRAVRWRTRSTTGPGPGLLLPFSRFGQSIAESKALAATRTHPETRGLAG